MRRLALLVLLAVLIAASAAQPAVAAGNSNGNGNGNGAENGSSGDNGNGGQSGSNAGGNGNGNGNAGGNGNSQAVENAGAAATTDASVPVVVPDEAGAVREAVKSKRALPLETITTIVGEITDGRILDVQLVSFRGTLLYDVTVIEGDGLVHRLYFGARTGHRVETQ